ATSILDQIDWSSIVVQDLPRFHDLVVTTIKTLAEHKRENQARQYLDRFDGTTQGTVSRLRYYKAASYVEWILGNFNAAIRLAREGIKLKTQDIDTDFDTRNELALALRDHGDWDEALTVFAPDLTVENILTDDQEHAVRGASFYGNVGRCLQFKSDLER